MEDRAGARGGQHRGAQASIRTPLSALAFAETLAEHLPAGVINVISGSGNAIGDHLVGHPKVRMVSITGDTATGKRVAKIAAETVKRLHLELGGKAPVIIFDDADLDLAAETLKSAGYWNAGQDCTAATRVLAGPDVYKDFVDKLADQVRSIKWGDPAEADDSGLSSSLPASILERSSTWLMRPSRWVPARCTRCSGSAAFSVPNRAALVTIISVSPMMALSGVRSSWLMLDTNCDLCSLASAS